MEVPPQFPVHTILSKSMEPNFRSGIWYAATSKHARLLQAAEEQAMTVECKEPPAFIFPCLSFLCPFHFTDYSLNLPSICFIPSYTKNISGSVSHTFIIFCWITFEIKFSWFKIKLLTQMLTVISRENKLLINMYGHCLALNGGGG